MEQIFDFVKYSTLILLFVILSVHIIIDVLDKIGWLPESLEKMLHKHKKALILEVLAEAGVKPRSYEEVVRHTLDALGVKPKVPWVKSINQVLDIRSEISLPESHPNLQELLGRIVAQYIEENEFTIGSTSKVPVQYYVNLRHAFCAAPYEEIDKRLAEIMLAHIKECFRRDGISTDAVVARKSGLNILGYLVARAMGLPLLLYTEDVSVWTPHPGESPTSRPRVIDYYLPPNSKAIIVDDSCVGGGSFRDLANNLRSNNILVAHAFVLFARREIDVVQALRSDGIELHALDFYCDADLQELYCPSKTAEPVQAQEIIAADSEKRII